MSSAPTTLPTGAAVNPAPQPVPPVSTSVSQPITSGTTNANLTTTNYSSYNSYGYPYGNNQYSYNGQYDAAAYAQYYNAYNSYYGYGQYNYQYNHTGQYNNYSNYYQTNQNQTQQTYTTTVATSQTNTTMPNTAVPPPPLPSTLPSYSTTQGTSQAPVVTTTTSSLGQVIPPPPPPPPMNMLSSLSTATTTQTVSSSVSAPLPPPAASQGVVAPSVSQAPSTATSTPGLASSLPAPPVMPSNFVTYSQPSSMMYPPPALNSQQYRPQNNMQTYSATQSAYNNYNYQYGAHNFQTPPPPLPNSATPSTTGVSTQPSQMKQPVVPFQPSVPPPNYPSYQHTYPYHNYNYTNQQMPLPYSSNGQTGYVNQAAPNQANSTHDVNSAAFSTPHQNNFSQKKAKVLKKKKGAGNSIDQPPPTVNTQPMNSSSSDMLTDQVRSDEKLVLRKDIGPANIAKPKGTFACLLGTVDFEIDEYDQSTESESDSDDSENKTTGNPQKEKSKLQSKSAYPKPAKVTKPVIPLDDLEMNPEAFGLPTKFVGRGPKVLPEDEEEETRFSETQNDYPYHKAFQEKNFGRTRNQFNRPNFGQRTNDFENPWNENNNWTNFRNETNIGDQPGKNTKVDPNPNILEASGQPSYSLKQRENEHQSILRKPLMNPNLKHHPNIGGEGNFNRNNSKSLNSSAGWPENEKITPGSSNVDSEDFDGRFQNYNKSELHAAFGGCDDKPPFLQDEKDFANRNMPPNISSFPIESRSDNFKEKPFYGKPFQKVNSDKFEGGFNETYNQSGGNDRFGSKFPTCKNQPGFNRNPNRFSGNANYGELNRDSNYDVMHKRQFNKPNFASEEHNEYEESFHDAKNSFSKDGSNRSNFRQGPSNRQFGNVNDSPFNSFDNFDKPPFERFDMSSNEKTDNFGDNTMRQFGEEPPIDRGSFSKNKKTPLLKDPMLTDIKHTGGQFPGNDIRPPFRSNQSFGDGKRQGMHSFEMAPPIKPPFMDKNFSKNDSQSAFMHPPPIRHPPPPFHEIKRKGNLSKDNNFPPLPPPPFLENMKMLGSFDRNEMQPPRPPFDKPSPNIPFGKMNEPNSQSNFSDDRRTFGDHNDRTFGRTENLKDEKFGQRDHPQNKLDSIHGKNTNKDEDGLLGKNKISEPSRRKKSRFDKEEPFMDNQLESPFNRNRNNSSNPEKPFRKTSRFEDIKSDENSKLKEKYSEKFDGSFHQESSPVKKARKFFSDTPQPVATQSGSQDEAKKSTEISNKQSVPFTKLVGTKTEKSNETVGNKLKEAKDKQATVVKNKNVTANTSPSPKPLLKVETKNSQKEKNGITDNSVKNSGTSQPKELKDSIADSANDSVKSKPVEIKGNKEDSVKDTQKESQTKVSEPSFVKKSPLSSISFLERLTSGSKSFKKSVSTSSSKAPETQSITKEKKPTSTASDVIPHKSKASPQSNSSKDSVSIASEIPSAVTSASHIFKSPSSITQSISPSVSVSLSIPTNLSASPITKNTSVNLTTTTCSSPVISTTSMTSSSPALPSLPVKQSASETKAASATVPTAAKPCTESVSKEKSTKTSTDLTKSLSWFTSSSPRTSVNKATAEKAKVEVTTPNVTSNITSSTTTTTSVEKKMTSETISELIPKSTSTTTVVSTASYAHTAITTTSVSKEPVKLLPSTTQLKTGEKSMECEKISQSLDTIPITTTPKPTASSSPLKESNPLSDIFGLDKDTIQTPVMLSTQPLIPNLPKTNDELLEDLILKVNDTSLRELMQPDFCKLCDVHHPASIVALQHYRSKGHANKVDTFLSIKANLEKNKAKVHGDDGLSQPCEVEFQCPDDASKPYFGDDHARKHIEHKPSDRRCRRRDNLDHDILESRGILDAGRGRGRGNRRMMRESRPFDRPEQVYFESENSPDRSPFDPFDVPDEPTFDSPQLESFGRRLDGYNEPPFNRHDEPPFNRGEGPSFNRHDGPRLDRLDGPSFNRSDRPPFNRHGKPPHNRDIDPSFNRFDDPPFNRHDEPPFNRHDEPPFSRHDGPPLDMCDDPSLGRRERSSFDRPPRGRGGGRGRGRGRGNLNSLLDMPIGSEMEDFDDVPEFDMEMPRHRPRGRGGQMSRRQGRSQDFDQEDMATRGRQFRQEFRGRGRPDNPGFKRGFQPRFNPMDDRGPPFEDFGPGPSAMKRPRKRFN